MAIPSIRTFLRESPFVLSLGGATITWQYVEHQQLSPIYLIESFVLVWLGYRSFQPAATALFRYERHIFLTALFLCFYLSGFPAYVLLAGVLLLAYRWPQSLSLRTVPVIKNVAIALAWTSCTTAVAIDPLTKGGLYLLSDGLLIVGLSMLSDARDAKTDHGTIKTVAHLMGTPMTIVTSGLCLMAYASLRMDTDKFWCLWPLLFALTGYTIVVRQLIKLQKDPTLWIDGGAIGIPLLTTYSLLML